MLGLDLADDSMDEVLVFRTGDTSLSSTVPNMPNQQGKCSGLGVGDEIEAIVADLKSKGVVFEHYDGMELKGDIHLAGAVKLVWLKDPDGNILHLYSM